MDISALLAQPLDIKKVPPYDPRSEPPPESVVLSKEWEMLENGKTHIFELLTDPLMRAGDEFAWTHALVDLVRQNIFYTKGEQVVVCVTGNMGGGKSATLNSIFNISEPIAREGGAGVSCTLASQSFTAALEGQTAPFLAKVCFFNATERHEILASYVRDYYRATHEADVDDDGEQIANSDDNPTIRDEVTTALVALFKDQRECRSKRDVRQFLDAAMSEDDPAILNKLYTWSDDLIGEFDGQEHDKDSVVILTASTPGALLSQLEPYATEGEEEAEDAGPAFWPFVSLIQFHFEDPLIELGIAFLDTPGLTDRNRTRRRSAQKYGRKKTHSMIVTDIMRAADDTSVTAEFKTMSTKGHDRVVVVMPKSDVMNDSNLPYGKPKEKRYALALKERRRALELELYKTEEDIQRCEDEGDDDSLVSLNQKKRKLEVLAKKAENQEKAHLIKMRTEHSVQKLQQKLEDIDDSVTVPVFAVANKAYGQHVRGYAAKKAPVLSVNETNIPDLRRWLAKLPNEARLSEAQYRQTHLLPQIIKRVELVTSKTPLQCKADLERHLQAPAGKHKTAIEDASARCIQQIRTSIVQPLVQYEQEWQGRAVRRCQDWADEFKTGAFLQLMNRSGHRRGRKNRVVNMSAELTEDGLDKVNRMLDRAKIYKMELERILLEKIDGLFDSMLQAINQDSKATFVDLSTFVEYARSRQDHARELVREATDDLLDRIELVKQNATSAEEDAYIVEAMLPVYEKVRVLKTTRGDRKTKPPGGWHAHRLAVFKHEVTKANGIWAAVYKNVEADLISCVKDVMIMLSDGVGEVFLELRDAFKNMCQAQESSDSGETPLQDQLVENLRKAEQHLSGPMQEALDSLLKTYGRQN